MSYYRNPMLVVGLLVLLGGIVLLFVPPLGDPAQEPGFAAYWWLAAPMIVAGIILMAMGRRRYMASKRSTE